MDGIKHIVFEFKDEEYKRANDYKNRHDRPTWKEMMLDYLDIKEAEEQIGE